MIDNNSKSLKILVVDFDGSEIDTINSIFVEIGFNYTIINYSEFDFHQINDDYKLLYFMYNDDLTFLKKLKSQIQDSLTNCNIPILFTIKPDQIPSVESELHGCVLDFVLYPYNLYVLQNRIKNHLRLINYKNEWELEKQHLEMLNKEKNEILAIAAHDLKNPIFSVQLLGKTIRDDDSLTKNELYEFSNDIVISCDRIIDIIKQLLDLNSIESGKIKVDIQKVNIIDSVKYLIELYRFKAERKHINIMMNIESEGSVITDLSAFKNIFDNFISNAIKYSPHHKTVKVSLYDVGNRVVVDIIDEGPGIHESEQPKLFKKFSKLSNQPTGGENSTGLGLSIVKKYSELINAEIFFKNNKNGVGATFSVSLPKS